jgi:hypothetical protein
MKNDSNENMLNLNDINSLNNNNIYNNNHNNNNNNFNIINNNPNNKFDYDLIEEKIIDARSGCSMIFMILITIPFCVIAIVSMWVFFSRNSDKYWLGIIFGILTFAFFSLIILSFCSCQGFFINEVNEAHVCTLFGKYIGTVKKNGFLFVNPFYSHKKISLKSNNLNGTVIKVNDKVGNPVMMGCVVVWRVKDTAKAIFEVEDYIHYVRIQSECAVRFVGCKFPYDKVNENDICLKSGEHEVNRVLIEELTERLAHAGIEVEEARITELSYANEIANVMLKRQAADAVVAAREKIVQGAVSIVGHAINALNDNDICKINREKKVQLVSNLMVVLCGESQQGGNVSATGSSSRLQEGIHKYN